MRINKQKLKGTSSWAKPKASSLTNNSLDFSNRPPLTYTFSKVVNITYIKTYMSSDETTT